MQRSAMAKGRPAKANSIYKVSVHVNNGRSYAVTHPYSVGEDGKRRKLIFPADWGLSEIEALSGTGHRGVVEYQGGDLDRMT